MSLAVLGIGTNIGDRQSNIKKALAALEHLPQTRLIKVSSVYETPPWGYEEQEKFYNICLILETELSPRVLLGGCLGIEAAFGRERPFKNSPRILDVDLLLYEGAESADKELTLPHPRIGERAFVLVPLKELLPDLKMDNADYRADYEAVDKSDIIKVGEAKG